MTGEISAAKTRFNEAHARMVANIVAEMDKATASTAEVEAEGIAAVKLPAAMIEQSRAEIREMTAEFATLTNGGPSGPLPGSKALLSDPSANSATQELQAQAKAAMDAAVAERNAAEKKTQTGTL